MIEKIMNDYHQNQQKIFTKHQSRIEEALTNCKTHERKILQKLILKISLILFFVIVIYYFL